MKSSHFQFIKPKQIVFCLSLRHMLSSIASDRSHSLQWQNCQQFIRDPNPFRCWVQVSELFSDLLPFLFPCRYLSLWCQWVDLDIRYMISMWDNFPTNWSHSQSWLDCRISRDENEMHPKPILFSYALECDSKVILEPNFLKVDRTPDLSHLGTRLDLTPIAGDEEDKSFLFIIGEIKRCWSKFKHYRCLDYYEYFR